MSQDRHLLEIKVKASPQKIHFYQQKIGTLLYYCYHQTRCRTLHAPQINCQSSLLTHHLIISRLWTELLATYMGLKSLAIEYSPTPSYAQAMLPSLTMSG